MQRADLAERGRPDIGEALRHLVFGAHVVRDRADRLRPPAATGHQQPEPLREDPRLAGARWRDDARRASAVGDGRELIGCEVGVDRRVDVGRELPVTDPHPMDDRAVDSGHDTDARAAVDPRGRAVGQDDIERTALACAAPHRLEPRTPHQSIATRVVVVGAHEEVQALARELEGRRQRMRRTVLHLRRPQRADVDAEVDHHGLARGPRPVQPGERVRGRGEHRLVDRHAFGTVPSPGHGVTGVDDHPPPEATAGVVGHGTHHGGGVRQHRRARTSRTSANVRRGVEEQLELDVVRVAEDEHCGARDRVRRRDRRAA